jgi:hypothetical protein
LTVEGDTEPFARRVVSWSWRYSMLRRIQGVVVNWWGLVLSYAGSIGRDKGCWLRRMDLSNLQFRSC